MKPLLICLFIFLTIPLVSLLRFNYFLPNEDGMNETLQDALFVIQNYQNINNKWPEKMSEVPEIKNFKYHETPITIDFNTQAVIFSARVANYYYKADFLWKITYGVFGSVDRYRGASYAFSAPVPFIPAAK